MKPHSTTTIAAMAMIAAMATTSSLLARPTDFREVSLWVRARETDQSIINQVKERRLMQALTSQQEATLKAQGASDPLVQALRGSNMIATSAEVAAAEVKPPAPRTSHSDSMPDSPADNLRIFDVSVGHPVNLSQWGGPDTEFVFRLWRLAGEDIVDAAIVDQVRTYTEVSTYVGQIDSDYQRTRPGSFSRHYTPYLDGMGHNSYLLPDSSLGFPVASSYYTSRGMTIDRQNPVLVKDVPYVLYPVYGPRGVSLYYIGHTSNTVKLAIDIAGS
jgi:hypothetical protein